MAALGVNQERAFGNRQRDAYQAIILLNFPSRKKLHIVLAVQPQFDRELGGFTNFGPVLRIIRFDVAQLDPLRLAHQSG
jgi:hypothetical protein